jgi:hypothetical protein
MSVSNGIINAPVQMPADLAAMFGVSGTDLATAITNAAINKWAKYKPVRLNSKDTVTGQWNASQNKWRSDAYWWKGDGKCGFTIDTFSDAGSISNANSFLFKLKNGQLPWTYGKPRGGSYNEPYRLQDFARYWNNAVPAVGECGVVDGQIVWVERTGSSTILQIDYDTPADDELNLTLRDFAINGASLTQYYLGMLLWRSSGNYLFVTSSSRVGTGTSISIDVEIGYSDTGEWSMVPFLCSSPISQGGSIPSATYLSAGITTPISFTIKPSSQTLEIFVSAAWANNNSRVECYVSLFNNLSSSRYISGITIYLISCTTASQDPSTGSTVATTTLGSCTVAAGGQYDYSMTYITSSRNQALYYWITARPTDSSIVFSNSYQQVEDEDAPLE